MDGEWCVQCASDRFSRSGHGLRDTFPFEAGIFVGHEIHHGPMQKLTLAVMTDVNGGKRHMYSDFNPLNTAILGVFGIMEGVGTA